MRTIQVSSTFCMLWENSHLLSLLCTVAGGESSGSTLYPSCRITGRELGDEDDSSSPVCRTIGRELTGTFALLLRTGSPATDEARTKKRKSQCRGNIMTVSDVANAKKKEY